MRLTLQIKLALISLTLLLIPITGFHFSELLQQDLLEGRRSTIQFSANAVALALSGRTGLFEEETFRELSATRDLYLFQLSNSIRLNGKPDDWQPQIRAAAEYGSAHLLLSPVPYNYNSLHYRHLTGIRGEYLYAIFIVTDDSIVYRRTRFPTRSGADHLRITLEDKKKALHHYSVSPTRPGWVNGFIVSDTFSPGPSTREEPRIQGMWLETSGGYVLELRIPARKVGKRLAFAIADVDDPDDPRLVSLVGTGTADEHDRPGRLIPPSIRIEEILKDFDRPNSRITVVDSNYRIRAGYGKLSGEDMDLPGDSSVLAGLSTLFHRALSPLYRYFTNPLARVFTEERIQPTTLEISGITETVEKGIPTVTSYVLEDEPVEIMAAISPLRHENLVVGAVIFEQTTNSILALQNRIIEESLTLFIIVFAVGGLGLIIYSSRLSSRIRTLGRQASSAISDRGRVHSTIQPPRINDEIGDLAKILRSMLLQLQTQTEYREKMADNLEHEMRTPLATISASLNNLSKELETPAGDISRYLEWAQADVKRLENLLTAIRDASSLEKALAMDQQEEFELDTAIGLWITHGWQPAYPGVQFNYDRLTDSVQVHADPGRVRQMLDKLIDNAVSFHDPGTPVELLLSASPGKATIKVVNRGPLVPEEMRSLIFDSMVSHRLKNRSGSHLGLGLYIVRTIVERYRGTVGVESLADESGTVFVVTLERVRR
jgi:two-component system sensor histidine kinase ChvG